MGGATGEYGSPYGSLVLAALAPHRNLLSSLHASAVLLTSRTSPRASESGSAIVRDCTPGMGHQPLLQGSCRPMPDLVWRSPPPPTRRGPDPDMSVH